MQFIFMFENIHFYVVLKIYSTLDKALLIKIKITTKILPSFGKIQ